MHTQISKTYEITIVLIKINNLPLSWWGTRSQTYPLLKHSKQPNLLQNLHPLDTAVYFLVKYLSINEPFSKNHLYSLLRWKKIFFSTQASTSCSDCKIQSEQRKWRNSVNFVYLPIFHKHIFTRSIFLIMFIPYHIHL